MPMKKENVKVTYDHAVDHMTDTRKEIPRTVAVQPNASLPETIDGLADKNRMACQYVIGKSPTEKYVSPGTIESMRPPKAEFKNG